MPRKEIVRVDAAEAEALLVAARAGFDAAVAVQPHHRHPLARAMAKLTAVVDSATPAVTTASADR